MNRESEIKVMSIALVMLQEADKLREQDRYAATANLPWRTFDALADAFREGGVETFTDHLGSPPANPETSALMDELAARFPDRVTQFAEPEDKEDA